jgi:undecaprenyl diphosphate synthase
MPLPPFIPDPTALAELGLSPDQLPRHVAIIMDGNGRWAQGGKERIEGICRGAERPHDGHGVLQPWLDQLTLYCLSSENWKRPQTELDFLMTLLHQYLIEERAEIMEQNIRFTVIGRHGAFGHCKRARSTRTSALARQHRHDAGAGDQLWQPRRDRGCRSNHWRK